MADIAVAVLLAQELIAKYGVGISYACKIASWEYNVDANKVFRLVTE